MKPHFVVTPFSRLYIVFLALLTFGVGCPVMAPPDALAVPTPTPTATANPNLVALSDDHFIYFAHIERLKAVRTLMREEVKYELDSGKLKKTYKKWLWGTWDADFEPTAEAVLGYIDEVSFTAVETAFKNYVAVPTAANRTALENACGAVGRKLAIIEGWNTVFKSFRWAAWECPNYVTGEAGFINGLIDYSIALSQLWENPSSSASSIDTKVDELRAYVARMFDGARMGAKLMVLADKLSMVLAIYGVGRAVWTLAGAVTVSSGGGAMLLAGVGGPNGALGMVQMSTGRLVTVSLSQAQQATILSSLSAAGLEGAVTAGLGDDLPEVNEPGTRKGDLQKLNKHQIKKFQEFLKAEGEEIHKVKTQGGASRRDYFYDKNTREVFYGNKNDTAHLEGTGYTIDEIMDFSL